MSFYKKMQSIMRRGYSAHLLDCKNSNCKRHRRYYRPLIKELAKIAKHGTIKIEGIKDDE